MVNEILECPIDDFLKYYAPFNPSNHSVTQVFDDLQKRFLLEEVGEAGRMTWTMTLADYTTSPSGIEAPEPTVFKSLEGIMDVLETVGYVNKDGTTRERVFSYKDCPSSTMISEIDGTNFKVDACITSDVEAKKVALSDVGAIAEFKKANVPMDAEDVSTHVGVIQVSGTNRSSRIA